MGYDHKEIERGVYGQPSKIREELEEFEDALDQGCHIMALVELADLMGAMKNITKRVFQEGHRVSSN